MMSHMAYKLVYNQFIRSCEVLLSHLISSNHSLRHIAETDSEVWMASTRCVLPLCPGEACWWTVEPASKQRSEGEKVRVGDDLILVSVSSERYLVSINHQEMMTVNVQIRKC